MSRRGPKCSYFVCGAISNNELLMETIQATTPDEASLLFKEKLGFTPKGISGPFFKKMTQVLEPTRELKFTNQIRKAVYNDWIVNAFILKEPENQAYLVFLKRSDDKKLPLPKGTITVPTSDLRFI